MCNVSCQSFCFSVSSLVLRWFLFIATHSCFMDVVFCLTFLTKLILIFPTTSWIVCFLSYLVCFGLCLLCGDFPKMCVTQSSLFIFYRETLGALGDQEGRAGGLVALGVGWLGGRPALSFDNLHLSSHPNINMCWSFLWGDLVSPERDLPDSSGRV